MSIFYDPKSRKPQAWVKIFFISVPIILGLAVYFYGQQLAKQKEVEDTQKPPVDIFNKISP